MCNPADSDDTPQSIHSLFLVKKKKKEEEEK